MALGTQKSRLGTDHSSLAGLKATKDASKRLGEIMAMPQSKSGKATHLLHFAPHLTKNQTSKDIQSLSR